MFDKDTLENFPNQEEEQNEDFSVKHLKTTDKTTLPCKSKRRNYTIQSMV